MSTHPHLGIEDEERQREVEVRSQSYAAFQRQILLAKLNSRSGTLRKLNLRLGMETGARGAPCFPIAPGLFWGTPGAIPAQD